MNRHNHGVAVHEHGSVDAQRLYTCSSYGSQRVSHAITSVWWLVYLDVRSMLLGTVRLQLSLAAVRALHHKH